MFAETEEDECDLCHLKKQSKDHTIQHGGETYYVCPQCYGNKATIISMWWLRC